MASPLLEFGRLLRSVGRFHFGEAEATPFRVGPPYIPPSQREMDLTMVGREIRAPQIIFADSENDGRGEFFERYGASDFWEIERINFLNRRLGFLFYSISAGSSSVASPDSVHTGPQVGRPVSGRTRHRRLPPSVAVCTCAQISAGSQVNPLDFDLPPDIGSSEIRPMGVLCNAPPKEIADRVGLLGQKEGDAT